MANWLVVHVSILLTGWLFEEECFFWLVVHVRILAISWLCM